MSVLLRRLHRCREQSALPPLYQERAFLEPNPFRLQRRSRFPCMIRLGRLRSIFLRPALHQGLRGFQRVQRPRQSHRRLFLDHHLKKGAAHDWFFG